VTPPSTATKLLIATRNDGKTREIRDLFTGLPFHLVFPIDQFLERLPDEADLERGTSFAENAVAKARYFAKRANLPTLAEDSGLEVDALDGAPGVFSARWAKMHGAGGAGGVGGMGGVGGADAANNALLLERLAGVPDEQRTARYRCVVAYLDTPLAKPQLVEATCEGSILSAPRGTGGFGYDPLFFSTELGMTFAEAAMPAKQRVSHRGRAIRALVEVLVRRSK
jgi:XTP/dITP diphosphohydrolase